MVNGSPPLRYISRIDSSRSHAWWVRIMRSDPQAGVPRVAVSKLFTDHLWGGKESALEAARLWRDEALVEFPRYRLRLEASA